MKIISWNLLTFLLVALIYSASCEVIPPSLLTSSSSPTLSRPLQKLLQLFGGNEAAALLQLPQYQGFIQLLNQIPSELFDQYLNQLGQGYVSKKSKGYNLTSEFSNWCQTFYTTYEKVLYPSDYSPVSGKQISSIQQFLKRSSKLGKRVRGAGLRHSWSSIFSDPQEHLISLYSEQVIDRTSQFFNGYFAQMGRLQSQMAALNVEHLNQIRKVGELTVAITQGDKSVKNVTKHLVKVGASVSNHQLRDWGKKNGYQIKSNTMITEISFVGALLTCSHGSGKNTQHLCDYVYEVQFIDHNGNRQRISKRENPKLIKSAASSLGLLGIVLFVTVEMEDLQIVKMIPRIEYKDFVIPWPKDYPPEKQRLRMERSEYKVWLQKKNSSLINQEYSWQNNMKRFIKAFNEDYAQWFYFPEEQTNIFENVWKAYSKSTLQNIAKIQKEDSQSVFLAQYPSPTQKSFSQFAFFLIGKFASSPATIPFYKAIFAQIIRIQSNEYKIFVVM